MLKKIAKTALLVALSMVLTGCGLISLRDFELQGAEIVRFDMSGGEVKMTIRNKSLFKITLTSGELAAYDGETLVGEVFVREPVVLPRRSTTTVTLRLGLRFSSPMAALRALNTLTKFPERLTISGYGEGRVWCFTKRFEREGVPISKFISIFGEPAQYFAGKTI